MPTLIDQIKSIYREAVEEAACTSKEKDGDDAVRYHYLEPLLFDGLKKLGFKRLGCGMSRTAYGNGTVVVKLGGRRSNIVEMQNVRKVREHGVWQYAVLPVLAHYFVDDHENWHSILITIQAKKLPIKNRDDCFPNEGAVIMNKKLQEQWKVINKVFYDCHDENVMRFGPGVVMIDLGNGLKEKDLEKHAAEFKNTLDFDEHVRLYNESMKQAMAHLEPVGVVA